MESLLKKLMFATIGVASVTKEKIEDLVDELIKKGQIEQQERANVVRELLDKAEDQTLRAKDWLEQQVNELFEKLRPEYQKKIDELSDKVNKLETEMQELLKSVKDSRKK